MFSNQPQVTVTVRVPATSANLGPGYDCLGIALTLYNTVRMTALGGFSSVSSTRPFNLTIRTTGVDADKIPRDSSNLVYQTAALVFERVATWPGQLVIELDGEIPVGSGLGSSSAAVVAGLMAANAMIGNQLSQSALLRMAAEVEGHPDNVAPAILGGLVLGIMPRDGSDDLLAERLPVPEMRVVVALPDFYFPTAQARTVVPQQIALQDAIHNASRVGLLVHALTTGDHDLLRIAMDDRLHQPYRLPLIPGAREAMAAAYDAGAAGVALSGAGPSLIAIAPANHDGIATSMVAAFDAAGLPARVWTLDVEQRGAHILGR